MWTHENRSLYERKGIRYPSDLTDREWALIAPPPKRWVVERTIAWINRCRRLAKDYENLNRTALASIRLMLRRLTRYCYPS